MLKEYDTSIYPRKIWVVRGESKEWLSDRFGSHDAEEMTFEEIEGNFDATVFPVQDKKEGWLGHMVVINRDLNANTLCHEAYHVAQSIYSDVGAEVDPINQEPFAYLIGYVAECINSFQIEYINQTKTENK